MGAAPRVIRTGEPGPAGDDLAEAVSVLERGGVVAHPTETVYGLAVDPWNAGAVARLAALKGRPEEAGFILIAPDRKSAERLIALPPPPHYVILAAAFWPGPLTLIVPASPEAPVGIAGSHRGIALRVTPDPVALALLRRFGRPLVSTSANLSGAPPARTAEEVLDRLGDRIDLVVDGGERRGGVPSTLVDLTGSEPELLRAGAVSSEDLERALGERPRGGAKR